MPVPIHIGASGDTPVVTLGDRFEKGEHHVHHCPRCCEEKPCTEECEYEPDLNDEEGEALRGPYCVCDECRGSAVLGQVLRHVRKKRGIRQHDVAATMGISGSALSRIENGGALSVAHLHAVAKALRTDAWMLLRDAALIEKMVISVDTIQAYVVRFDLLSLAEAGR